MIISNAIIYPFVSMSRIEGRQNAVNTLKDIWECFMPRIPEKEHSVDACVVTTMGLYGNTHAQTRQDQRRLCGKFNRDFKVQIFEKARTDANTNPTAYQVREWDGLIHTPETLDTVTKEVGRLRHLYQISSEYRRAVQELCASYNRPLNDGNLAFFHEEFSVLYLVGTRKIGVPADSKSLRTDNNGGLYIAYAGPIPEAEILAWNYLHGKRAFPKNRSFYVDTTDRSSPVFTDFGTIVGP